MKFLKLVAAGAVLALAATTAACSETPRNSDGEAIPRVAILNLANVPSLNDIVDGIVEELENQGYSGDKIILDIQNANGDISLAQTIASKFVDDKPDVIVTVTTPALQAAVTAAKPENSIPIVFAAVSDPVSAGAVDSLDGATGTNVSGVYNINPIPEALDLALEIMPNLKTVGIIYNPGEDNSVVDAKVMKEEAEARGIKLVEATADNSNNVQSAAQSIVDRVDVIMLIQDTTVATAQAVVNKVAREAGILVMAIDAQLVTEGAVAGLGRSAKVTGAQTATMIIEILKGKKVGEIPLQPVIPATAVINLEAARLTGITIPKSVLDSAEVVVE